MDASSTEPSYDLAGSEARLRLATDAAAIGIWTWEIATEAVYWSEQCFAIFGVSSFQGVRDDFANAVHPDDAPALWEQVADAIASRRQFRAEFRIRRPDGSLRWLTNLGRAEYDDGGRPLRMLGTVQDITDRKQAEHELARAYAERDAVVLAVAHELRNFVNGIGLSVAVLRHARTEPRERDEALNRLQRQSDSMVRLVADLLDVSKVGMGQLVIELEPVALHDVLERALDVARPEVRRRSQALTVELPKDRLILRGDGVRLCQVFANVLLNAAKYTPDDGSIQLVARRRGAEVHVDVTDTGKGIEAAQMPMVFDLYRQIDSRSAGLGIGLYMARHFVERHGGTISAASKGFGHGTTFTIVLPLSESPVTPVSLD